MSEPTHPSVEEIAVVLSHLADRVAAEEKPGLDPVVRTSLLRVLDELELHIPGLEVPPDAAAARELAGFAEAALLKGREREALARALRGLSFSPHDPNLHYLAGSACLELGAVPEAVRLLTHTVWIHPGHPDARRDLEALSFLPGAAVASDTFSAPDCDADPLADWELDTESGPWFDGEDGEEKRAA